VKKFHTDNWTFDPNNRLLTRVGKKSVKLRYKASRLLELLCENSGQVIGNYQIIEHVWGDHTAVGDRGLRQIIWQLRQDLHEENSSEPAVINIPRKGYVLRDKVELSLSNLPERVKRRDLRVGFVVVSLLFLAVGYLYFSQESTPSSFLTTESVTSQEGLEESAAISPGGDRLLYSYKKDKSFDLYLKHINAERSDDTPLLQIEGNQGGAAWSYQEDKVAFLSNTEKPDVDAVYIYDLGTSELKHIASQYVPRISRSPHGLAWSPIADELAYTSLTENGKSAIFLYDYQTDTHRQLTKPEFIDMHPSWSPDGRFITFLKLINPELSGLYSHELITGAVTDITQENVKVYGNAWLDDRFIIYGAYGEGYFRPYVVDFKTLKKSRILMSGNFRYPSASPEHIYYIRSSLGSQIQEFSLNEGELVLENLLDSTGNDSEPIQHELTSHLIFMSNRTDHKELWFRDGEDNSSIQITDKQTNVSYPSFSSDGSMIIYRFYNPATQANELEIYDLDSRRKIPVPVSDVLFGTFAGNNRYIAYLKSADQDKELWLYDLKDQSQRRLMTGLWTILGANRKDNTLYIAKSGEVLIYNVEDQSVSSLMPESEFPNPVAISNELIFSVEKKGDITHIMQFNSHTKEKKVWATVKSIFFNQLVDLAVNPQTGKVYISFNTKRDSDVQRFSRAQLRSEIDRIFR